MTQRSTDHARSAAQLVVQAHESVAEANTKLQRMQTVHAGDDGFQRPNLEDQQGNR